MSESLSAAQFRDLYHGTKASRAEPIRENGLLPQHEPLEPERWYMVTSRKDEAAHFAGADDGAVITYHVPEGPGRRVLVPRAAGTVTERARQREAGE
jgi:hypothetical protein